MFVSIKDSFKKAIWGRITIRLAGRVDIEANPSEFFRKFEELFRICNDPSRARRGKDHTIVMIDLTAVDFIYPSALIFLLSLNESLNNLVQLNFKLAQKSKLHEYLCNCGFSQVYPIPPIPEGSFRHLVDKAVVIELQIGDEIPDLESKARWFTDLVNVGQTMEIRFRDRSEESIYEIFKNVKDHSEATKHYLLGQGYPNSGKVRFAVYDNGVGIRRHLVKVKYQKKHPYFKDIISDSEFRKMRQEPANFAIEKASIYGVSATKYIDNSGAGLNFLINDFSRPYAGVVSILSEDGYVSWRNGELSESLSLQLNIKGTLVSITAKGLTGEDGKSTETHYDRT
jgi:hypothetical protein